MIAVLAERHSIRIACRALSVSTSGYYGWQRRQHAPSLHAQQDALLTEQIRAIHAESGRTYGSPRIHAALRKTAVRCSKHRVVRLMRQADICSVRARKRRRASSTDSNHALPVAANVLARNFTAEAPNQKWAADVTYIPTRTGWLYLAVVLDLFSRRIVGWTTSTSFNRQLVCRALNNALYLRKAPALIHSDRGSQYASIDYQTLLKNAHIQCSMSRRGNPYDNAMVESLFATFKAEAMSEGIFDNPTQAQQATFAYIEGFYNRRRLHSSLDHECPDTFERAYYDAQRKNLA